MSSYRSSGAVTQASKRTLLTFALLVFAAGPFLLAVSSLPELEMGNPMLNENRLEGLALAPDFPEHLEWLNTEFPIPLQNLKGKIVLLDFWTYCCINCMHVIPDLKKLEARYPQELVILGVHSAKFTTEKGTDNIRRAILRYGIKHPVINDKNFEVWNAYGAKSWPTLVLINPRGKIVGVHSGEGVFELFDSAIAQTIRYFDSKGEIDRKPLALKLEKENVRDSKLSFPGKIHADARGKRLFITDSNHHRIVITDLDGKVLEVIGSGMMGNQNGSFEAAAFNQPQGTWLDGNLLYIADTENHLIRRADLTSRTVATIIGTGTQARSLNLKGKGTAAALSSPWDLLAHHRKLYIAMAGQHQLWSADLKSLEAEPYAGSGREARIDAPLLEAALAQPSGITADGSRLYFADSEVSSIRSADLDSSGKVQTIIGEDLFEYGDIDGGREVARLQHPLGVVYHNDALYVADTYNSKIKKIDPEKKTSTTLAGTGKHGLKDGKFLEAEFHEPAGITALGNKLYVADTNNHVIRVIHLDDGEVTTLRLQGMDVSTEHSP